MLKSIQTSVLWRQRHAASLRVLFVAMILAVAAVSAIVSISEILQNSLTKASSTFMAGDRQLTSPRQVSEEWLEKAESLGLQQALSVEFTTMLRTDASTETPRFQLVTVKAVDGAYPLKGQLDIKRPDALQEEKVSAGPSAGQVWMQARLFSLLALTDGGRVHIGDAVFETDSELVQEPDVSFQLGGLTPRVMIAYEDLEKTAVVQAGSRVKWRYYFAGQDDAIETFESWIKPQIVSSQRWQSIKEGRPAISSALGKADHYLLLGGSLAVLLAALAVAISARQFALEQYDRVAIMKVLGMTGRTLLARYLNELLFLGAVAIGIGGLLGMVSVNAWVAWVAQESEFIVYTGWQLLPLRSFWLSVGTVLIFLVSFAYPQLWHLKQTPPMRVLRRADSDSAFSGRIAQLLAVFGVLLLLYWYGRDAQLLLILLLGVAGVSVLVALVHTGLLKGVAKPLKGALSLGSAMQLTVSGLLRRRRQTIVQLTVVTLSLFLFASLYLVRTGLIRDWQAQLPEDAPNHFLINIAPEEISDVGGFLESNGLESSGIYPMVRGRLSHINGVDVKVAVTKDVGALNRELNLSWTEMLPEDNEIEAGSWWPELGQDGATGVSIESELAERLEVGMGDSLTFAMPGESFDAVITSVRTVQWDSMRPNFYMLFPKGRLSPYPVSYISSFYLPGESKDVLNSFSERFPTVSILELDGLITKIKSIVAQVSQMIELLLSFILLSALLVLAALVTASRDDRVNEATIFRVLGASRDRLFKVQCIEFICIGMIAGAVSLVGAELCVALLKQQVFEGGFHPDPLFWFAFPLASALILATFGLWQTRGIADTSPMRILRS